MTESTAEDGATQPPKRRRGATPLRRAPDECAVCLSRLQDPLVTPCGHSFCRRCLTQYLDFGRSQSSTDSQSKPCPTCATPLPALESAYPNSALRAILATRPKSTSHAPSSTLDVGALSDPAVSALLRQLLERHSASRAADASIGAEMVLAFLARARRARRRARDDAARDLALIDEDLRRILQRKPLAGAGLSDELATEVARARNGVGTGIDRTAVTVGQRGESIGATVGPKSSGVHEIQTHELEDAQNAGGQADDVVARRRSSRSRPREAQEGASPTPTSRSNQPVRNSAGSSNLEGSQNSRAQSGGDVKDENPSPVAPFSQSQSQSCSQGAMGDQVTCLSGLARQSVPAVTSATSAICSRTALIDRFHDDVQAMYFERRARMGPAALESVSETLVRATSLSIARRRASVKHIDILNSPHSLLSAVQFNKEGNIFAAAGVAKRIKLFDFDSLLADQDELHVPLCEMPATSKLTSLSWSRASSSVLAAGAFSGAVTIHDIEANSQVHAFSDHSARTWSVDFGSHHPHLLLSGSDDKTVRLWDTGRAPCGALTLSAKASVCSVKFNPYAAHELAFGCADHNVYSYDIRHPRSPICVFEGHWRAVSYVHFLNRSDLVSASTDSSCKMWNVREQEPGLSYGGHVNERNFVGLCGDRDFFACGSEDNAVYVYHKALTGPVVRYGLESTGAFVSSVCWKTESNMLVATNNVGTIEVIELA